MEEVKDKKVSKFFEVESLKFQKSIDDISKKVESLFKKMDDKFGGMYNQLLRVFLVNLEKRTYANEAATKALIEVICSKMYYVEMQAGKIDGHTGFAEYKSNFESLIDNQITSFYASNKKELQDAEKIS